MYWDVAVMSSIVLLLSNTFAVTIHFNPFKTMRMLKKENKFIRSFKIDPELSMNTPETIRNRNYPVELHNVTTRDGYILQLHRIPSSQPRIDGGRQSKVVFIQHGFLATSASGLIRGVGANRTKNGSLTFLLADRGYDVWLGNSRGNIYSRKHVTLDPEKQEYWDFSWDEMGKEDIPSMFKYVLNVTGEEKLSFICGSFGCTLFFIAMNAEPELNNSIEVAVALGPSGSLGNVKIPFFTQFLAPYWDEIEFYYKYIRRARAFLDISNIPDFRPISRLFCWNRRITNDRICDKISRQYRSVKGYILNYWIPIGSLDYPSGTSLKTMRHFELNYRAGDILAFDYGPKENMKRYGSVKPLRYDLSRVTAPVYIFWSETDLHVPKEDIDWIAERLGNWKASIKVNATYNHFELLGAPDANQVVNYPLLNLLPKP